MVKNHNSTEHWGSQLGVILAVAGSAVGLGNFLRFPGQAVNYGGGTFMIPYMISLLLIAIPVSMSEWALGRYAGRHGFHSPLGMYYVASGGKKIWGVVGGLSVIVPFVINMYYIFVESWCLLYALKYLGGVLEQPLDVDKIVVPDPDGRRVLLSPLLIQYGKRILSFAYTDSTIYSSEVGAELFPVLRRYVLCTVPDQMHHTTTDNSCRERVRYRLFKT